MIRAHYVSLVWFSLILGLGPRLASGSVLGCYRSAGCIESDNTDTLETVIKCIRQVPDFLCSHGDIVSWSTGVASKCIQSQSSTLLGAAASLLGGSLPSESATCLYNEAKGNIPECAKPALNAVETCLKNNNLELNNCLIDNFYCVLDYATDFYSKTLVVDADEFNRDFDVQGNVEFVGSQLHVAANTTIQSRSLNVVYEKKDNMYCLPHPKQDALGENGGSKTETQEECEHMDSCSGILSVGGQVAMCAKGTFAALPSSLLPLGTLINVYHKKLGGRRLVPVSDTANIEALRQLSAATQKKQNKNRMKSQQAWLTFEKSSDTLEACVGINKNMKPKKSLKKITSINGKKVQSMCASFKPGPPAELEVYAVDETSYSLVSTKVLRASVKMGYKRGIAFSVDENGNWQAEVFAEVNGELKLLGHEIGSASAKVSWDVDEMVGTFLSDPLSLLKFEFIQIRVEICVFGWCTYICVNSVDTCLASRAALPAALALPIYYANLVDT